jgi:hypothetical protein
MEEGREDPARLLGRHGAGPQELQRQLWQTDEEKVADPADKDAKPSPDRSSDATGLDQQRSLARGPFDAPMGEITGQPVEQPAA